MKYTVMVNVLVELVIEVDADSQNGAAQVAKAEAELTLEQCLCEVDYSIIQNNAVWTTETENLR